MLVANKTSAAISWPLVAFEKVAIAQSDRGRRLKQRDYLTEGAIPVIDQEQRLVGGYTDDENASFVGDLPVVLFGDHTRAVKLIHHRFAVGADGIKIFRPAEGVRAKYLYYWMKSARIPDRGYGRHYQYLRALSVQLPPVEHQDKIVAEIEKQFSRLDEAVANLQRVKANLKRYEKATIESLTNPETFEECVSGTIADVAISLDNMRKPVNKAERATRPGNVPYLGANGQAGWIDAHLFDEEIVLVVEDETFVGRTAPFSYYFAEKCWVNNHTHVLRARLGAVLPKYLNLALSYYPFIPLTTGSTGRRKLTKGALMAARIRVPSLAKQREVVAEVDRRLSLVRSVSNEVDANLQRAQALRQAILSRAFTSQGTSE